MKNTFIISAFLLLALISHAQISNLKIGYQEFPTNLTGHASDSVGNRYYSGYFKGELKVNNVVEGTGAGLEDIFLVKQDAAGNTIFSKSFGSKSSDEPIADGLSYFKNNLYLACQITDALSFQYISIDPYPGTGSINTGCIVSLDTSGNVKWVNKTSLKITNIYTADNIINVLGITSADDVKYNNQVLYQNLPGHSIIHLMLDTLGNLTSYKSIISPVSTIYDVQSPLFISSYSDGKLSLLLKIYGNSSFQFENQNIPLPAQIAYYSVLIKTDTSYSSISYKILNPVPLNFLLTNENLNPPITLSKQDSIYLILSCYEDSTNLNYDGLNVPVDYNHSTLVVLDSSLKTSRVVAMGNVSGSEFNTGRGRLFFRTLNIINNDLFISGTFTGLNESPTSETIADVQDITIIPNLHATFDLNGASESFVAKTSLGFNNGSVYRFGNHSEYENPSLFYNFSHVANDSILAYSFIDDNVWNPRIININTGIVSGSMMRDADLPDAVRFVEYFSDGSRLVLGWAQGRTSLDTSVIGIKCNRSRADAFIARITSKEEVKWYKRIPSTLLGAYPEKLLMKSDTAYFLINYGGTVNQNDYIKVNNKSYTAYANHSLLASIDTSGNINVINLENNLIANAFIMDFDLFNNGDLGILTRADYFNAIPVPFPNPGFILLRVSPVTNDLILTRKVITHDSYSFYPTKVDIDSYDNLYISLPLYFTVNPQDQYTSVGLHDGTGLIDSITVENNVATRGGLGILKMNMNKFDWYKRAKSSNYFNVISDLPSTFATKNKVIFMGQPIPQNLADTSSGSFYWDDKLIMPDMSPSKTYIFRMDTSGTIEMTKSISDFELRFAKKNAVGSLLISGAISKATSIDTISIGFQGGYDALSFVIDSTFKTTQNYRLASPYLEYMSDIAIWKDSLYSLAFTAQTVPSLYKNRPSVLTDDYNPDAYLSSSVIQDLVVLPLQLISFNGIKKEDIVYLDWSVVSNGEVNRYIVQRSFNGSGFKDIGMRSSINRSTVITYRITDNLKDYGKYYYRLQIISVDGKITYSKVISVINSPKKNSFYFDNNSHVLHILREDNHAYAWRIFDASGKTILSGQRAIGSKQIDMTKQQKSEYIIQTYDALLTSQTFKFIK